ncbi:MAG: hypothetical protein H7842_13490 [Gammaproteobacteria bacterium SHHR-1]
MPTKSKQNKHKQKDHKQKDSRFVCEIDRHLNKRTGARQANTLDQAEALNAYRILLTTPRADVSLKVSGSLGEATMTESIYAPLLDQLADHKPKTLGQLQQALAEQGIGMPQLLEAALLLSGAGHLAPVQDEAISRKAKKPSDALNARLKALARSSNDIGYLSSPVSGGGIPVNRFEQLFLLAREQGHKAPADWAQFVWNLLSLQGQKLVKEGKTLETDADNLAELTAQAETFETKRLPILHALQIA